MAYAARAGLFLTPYERRLLPLTNAMGAHRLFAARLGGGFRPGSLTETRRGLPSSFNVEILSAAAALEAEAREVPTRENQRALSAAQLVLGSYDEAVENLERLARSAPGDAALSSDLAAAYLVRAEKTGRMADPPRALEHALRARELAPASPEALMNRALALEQMHLHEDARSAWIEARAAEKDAAWLAVIEAERLRAESDEWIDREGFLERLSRAVDRGALAEVEALARESPEGVRSWFFSNGLKAAAEPRGREALSRLGPALARSLDDPDVPDAIRQISVLPEADGATLRLVSEVAMLHESNRWGEAETILARLQTAPRLPPNLRGWRDLWQAVTDLQRGDSARARERLDRLLGTANASRQPFLCGRAHYVRSVIASSGGQPDLSIRHRREAARLFAKAGEPSWAAFAGQQVGEAHGKLGLTEVDWEARLEALKRAPRLFNPRSALLSVTVVGDDLVRSGLPRAAAAVYRSAHARAISAGLQDSAADTANGVALALRTIDRAGAKEAALTAARMASMIEDPLLRARMSGEALRVRATVEPENDALVAEALQWLGNRGSWGRQIPLMTAHGLALMRAGRIDPATKALGEAVTLYEAKRPDDPELSDAGSDQIRPAYAALAEIAAGRGDAEQARVADLAVRYWAATSNVRSGALPGGGATGCSLAFIPASKSLLSWLVCGGRSRFRAAPIDADRRRELVGAFVAARRNGLPGEAEGRRLAAVLLGPWESEIAKARALTLTVTEDLARVPFAALPLSDGIRLGARAALTYAPAPESAPPAPPAPWRSPLIVTASPDGPEFPKLPRASIEAATLARQLRARLLSGEEATTERILSLLPKADFFYFSGHALVNASRPFDSSLVLVDSSNRPSFLTIRRVRSLDLRGLRLAVLAGCSTAEAGDVGSMTLAGAFLAAGARSVVGTLWPVPDDAMGRLMPRFFEYLESEGSPSRALARLRNDASLTSEDLAVADALAVTEFARPEASASPSSSRH
ncbi:MAG: CHAT domain-containing protein [Vicinamibacteria bacterium]|nr:CHAT domain-containing protein [Vicinamibacteria bacterium]